VLARSEDLGGPPAAALPGPATVVPPPVTTPPPGPLIRDPGPRIEEPSRAVVSVGPTNTSSARSDDVRGSTAAAPPATVPPDSGFGEPGPRTEEPSRAVVSVRPASSALARSDDARGSTATAVPATIIPTPETGVPARESGSANLASPPAESSKAVIGLLLQRGDAALAVGDVIAARLLFERAASLGSISAATAAGKTYDVDFLSRSGARGIRADPAIAAAWFRKAAARGDTEARARLDRIEGKSRR